MQSGRSSSLLLQLLHELLCTLSVASLACLAREVGSFASQGQGLGWDALPVIDHSQAKAHPRNAVEVANLPPDRKRLFEAND